MALLSIKILFLIQFFAYDWRLSNQISAEKLNEFIEENNYTDVVLVCHSMGGLVASGYLAMGEFQQSKIETIIMIGSPLLGTPVMPDIWESEDIWQLMSEISISERFKSIWKVFTLFFDPADSYMGNFGSLYELFPTERYIDENYVDQIYLYNKDNALNTYEQTQELFEIYWSDYNPTLAASAKVFHDSLYYGASNEHITYLTTTYYIAGYGKDTTNKITFACDYVLEPGLDGDFYYRQLTWCETEKTQEGDNMVPVCSATLGDKYGNKTFFVSGVDHASLVDDSQVLSFINRLIVGNTSVSAFNKIAEELQ